MLESKNIKLRALEFSDVDNLYNWENDRASWKVSHTIAPYSRHILKDYIHSVSDIYTDKQLRLIMEDKATGKALGTVDLFDCDFKNRKAGIGILISDVSDRRKGIASEVLESLIPYCFEVLGFHQVYCNILEDNEESLHLFGKMGFEKIGLKTDWVYVDGRFQNEWLLQKINTDEKKQ